MLFVRINYAILSDFGVKIYSHICINSNFPHKITNYKLLLSIESCHVFKITL